jgi:hydrogenase nickel incorporation protein HypA/HybF
MAIARNIVDIAVAAATGANASRIVRVNVLVGQLRGIIPAQLIFCFGLMSENTIAGGAHLNLEITPVIGRCRQCQEDFPVKDYSYVCPLCQGEDIEMVGGTELRVRDIEAE